MSHPTLRVWLSLLALAPACGYGPPATLACGDFAEARCARRMTCSGGIDLARLYGDLATCLERERLQCTLSLAAPSTGSSPLAVDQCVVALAGVSCFDFYAGNLPAACSFVGPRAMNAPCALNAQCASGYCAGNKTSECGVCGAPPNPGSPCVSSTCGRGSQCVPRTLQCQSVPSSGAACDNNSLPCGADLSCVGNTGGQMGMCVPAIAVAGAPCGGTLAGCDPTIGLECAGTTTSRTCRTIPLAANGMACGAIPNGTFGGCAAGDCYTAAGIALANEVGTCKAHAGDGQPCDAVLGPSCLLPSRCVISAGGTAGVCTLPSGARCG